jgi:hypothetical protein
MKTLVPSVALLCSALVMMNSCSVSKNSILPPKNDAENIDGNSYSCYVIKTDGSKQYYSSLKLVTGVLTTPHLLGDNKSVIEAKDVLAYQDNRRYAVSQKLLVTKKTSYVAAETLPGFAVRVAKGKLNVYSRKFYNGNISVTEYFLQNGDEGEIVSYSQTVMNDLLKDNTKAADFYNSKVKISPKSKKLMAAVDLYNNAPQFISKN